MDVRLSPEQHQLRDAVARAVRDLAPRSVADLDDRDRRARLDVAVAAAGWRGLRVGDAEGAPLGSGVDAALIAEELGRGLADVAFVGPTLAAEARRLAALAPSDAPETVAVRADLSGLATLDDTDPALVAFDAAGAGAALCLLDDATLGRIAVTAVEPGIDLTRPMGRLAAAAEPSRGARPFDEVAMARWEALALVLGAADLIGVMAGAVALGCEYACARRQFDTPVGTFQSVQHMLADAFVATEGSRSTTLHAAWALDAAEPADALAAAAAAKAYAARAARGVCEAVIQVHGGIGNTWDCLAHVFLRRALASIDLAGGVGPNLARVRQHAGIHPQREVTGGLR